MTAKRSHKYAAREADWSPQWDRDSAGSSYDLAMSEAAEAEWRESPPRPTPQTFAPLPPSFFARVQARKYRNAEALREGFRLRDQREAEAAAARLITDKEGPCRPE